MKRVTKRESVKAMREREREKRPFIKPAANWDSTKIMGGDTLMKTCYVLPLLPSYLSATERKRRRRCSENKEVGRDEESMKKDWRRVRASTVLLQKKEKRNKNWVKTELIPARISCCNKFSVATSKVRVKGSYEPGYCSITLKYNYVSSRRLFSTVAIDSSLYFASVPTHSCVFALPGFKTKNTHTHKKTKEKLPSKVEPNERAQLEKLFPGKIPSIMLLHWKSDNLRWQSLDLVRRAMIGIMKKTDSAS